MQPTMKLRWRIAKHGEECVAIGPQYRCHFGDDFDHIQGHVLQQWWEGQILKEEYRSLPPGSIIPWDGKSVVDMYETHGEWRDIEIAEE